MQQPDQPRLVNQIRDERRAGADHEHRVRLIDVCGILIQERVSDALFITRKSVDRQKSLFQSVVDVGLCFQLCQRRAEIAMGCAFAFPVTQSTLPLSTPRTVDPMKLTSLLSVAGIIPDFGDAGIASRIPTGW